MSIIQQFLIPAYETPSDPSGTYGYWAQFYNNAPTVAWLIANYQAGPPPANTTSFTTGISNAHTAGAKVLGYVHTSKGARALATVEADIDSWYANYTVDGIMLDEVQASSANLSYYTSLYNYIKAKDATRNFVVLNNATMPQTESYMAICDVVSLFEDAYENFSLNFAAYTTSSWKNNYAANRFWASIYRIPQQSYMQAVIDIAKTQGIGYIYVSDQIPDQTYSLPPSSGFWTAAIAEAQRTSFPATFASFMTHA